MTPVLAGLKQDEYFEENIDKTRRKKISLEDLHDNNPMNRNKTDSNNKEIQINGYKLLKIATPLPNQMLSPLITWGQIEDEPVKIPDKQKDFRFQRASCRELIADDLTKKMNLKKDII